MTDQEKQIESLQQEVKRLQDIMHGEPKTKKFIYDEEQGIEVEIQHWAVKVLYYNLYQSFKDLGGENFATMTVGHPEGGVPLEITIRPTNKKTPVAMFSELKQTIIEALSKRTAKEIKAVLQAKLDSLPQEGKE